MKDDIKFWRDCTCIGEIRSRSQGNNFLWNRMIACAPLSVLHLEILCFISRFTCWNQSNLHNITFLSIMGMLFIILSWLLISLQNCCEQELINWKPLLYFLHGHCLYLNAIHLTIDNCITQKTQYVLTKSRILNPVWHTIR